MSGHPYDKGYGQPYQQYQLTPDDRTWGMLAHISPIVLGFIGPLIIWLVYKDKSPFISDQAKEALNFSLSIMIVALICTATCIGIIVLPVFTIGGLVYSIIGGMEANKGVWYRYPYNIRMIN